MKSVLLIANGGRLSFICMIPPWKTGTRIILVLAKTGEFCYCLAALVYGSMEVVRGGVHSGYAMPDIQRD
jgi:hypothetical protein